MHWHYSSLRPLFLYVLTFINAWMTFKWSHFVSQIRLLPSPHTHCPWRLESSFRHRLTSTQLNPAHNQRIFVRLARSWFIVSWPELRFVILLNSFFFPALFFRVRFFTWRGSCTRPLFDWQDYVSVDHMWRLCYGLALGNCFVSLTVWLLCEWRYAKIE